MPKKPTATTKNPPRKDSPRSQPDSFLTVVRFRCAGGKCMVKPGHNVHIGEGAVILYAENTAVSLNFNGPKGSPFVSGTREIPIEKGKWRLEFVHPDAKEKYTYDARACDGCDPIPARIPPEMIVP